MSWVTLRMCYTVPKCVQATRRRIAGGSCSPSWRRRPLSGPKSPRWRYPATRPPGPPRGANSTSWGAPWAPSPATLTPWRYMIPSKTGAHSSSIYHIFKMEINCGNLFAKLYPISTIHLYSIHYTYYYTYNMLYTFIFFFRNFISILSFPKHSMG